jgi:hypothetical protein
VLNDPGGRELLMDKYGLRKVPVVAKGDKWVFGQMLDAVANFVGLEGTGVARLAPQQLFEKQRLVYAAAQRFVRQFPPERFNEQVIPNRPRLTRVLCFHVFRIGAAFLESWDGKEYSTNIADNPPDDTKQTQDQIARYGADIWKQIDAWWAGMEDHTMSRMLKTYYGDTPAHQVYERVTWHSAQHCRQLMHVLERMGIQPDGPLTAQDLAGLPLPERLFE